jgi:hypothetical protein
LGSVTGEDILPRFNVEPTYGNGGDDLAAHDLPLQLNQRGFQLRSHQQSSLTQPR